AVEHVGQFSMQISIGNGSVLCAYQQPFPASWARLPEQLTALSPKWPRQWLQVTMTSGIGKHYDF
ncbi:hypothetical protein, partial [Paraburkholderia sp. SIMBA_053]|uniref:hypothetical protein n=1 Tax=Paraburkholderia sp. SIMBA_053 TaxID=3085794 RepID=UPI00397BC642